MIFHWSGACHKPQNCPGVGSEEFSTPEHGFLTPKHGILNIKVYFESLKLEIMTLLES